jgi:hypothetical protein
MRSAARNFLAISFSILIGTLAQRADAAFTQANLAGNWSGTWTQTSNGVVIIPNLTLTIDAAGNVTSSSGAVTGQLTILDPSTGALTGTLVFGSYTFTPALVNISSPGQNGQPFRIQGQFNTSSLPFPNDNDSIDVSGGPVVSVPPTITGTATASGSVAVPFSYSVTVAGTPAPTLTVSGTLPPGVTQNGTTLSGNPTTAGSYNVVFTATNSAGIATLNVTINIGPPVPPVFTSPGTLTVSVFQNFSTPLAATGSQPVLFSAGTLPPGVSFSLGYIVSGKFTVPGTYLVPVTATNIAGPVEQNIIITVTPLDPNANLNGDGVPNFVALKLGLDPSDPNQTPFNGEPALGVTRLSLGKMSVKLKSGKDAISISGTLPALGKYSIANEHVTILIGNIVQSVQLTKGGSGTVQNSAGKTKVRIAGGKGMGTQNAPFQINLSGNFAPLLTDGGFSGRSDATIPVTILFSRTVFTINVTYSAASHQFSSVQ